MPYTNPMKGIYRIDIPLLSRHGFRVQILRSGHIRSKFFSDKAHGGREQALAAAQEYYPKLLAVVGPPGKRTPHTNVIPIVGSRPLRPATFQDPPTGEIVWVQCSDRRCLAFRDEYGFWVSFYTRRRLEDFVRVIE